MLFYVIISILFFSITICNLLIESPSYDLYQWLQLQFYVFLMMSAMGARNM